MQTSIFYGSLYEASACQFKQSWCLVVYLYTCAWESTLVFCFHTKLLKPLDSLQSELDNNIISWNLRPRIIASFVNGLTLKSGSWIEHLCRAGCFTRWEHFQISSLCGLSRPYTAYFSSDETKNSWKGLCIPTHFNTELDFSYTSQHMQF